MSVPCPDSFAICLNTCSLLEDYEVAASYFRQLAPFYAKDDWSSLELLTLDLYAQCLHHLQRDDDYNRVGLRILAETVRSDATVRQRSKVNPMKLVHTRQPPHSAAGSLSGVLNASKSLKENLPVQMDTYFNRIEMGLYVRHSPYDDGFEFPLVLGSLFPESFLAESVGVQLLSVKEDQRSELWLHADCQNIEPGTSRIWLRSNVSQCIQLPVLASLIMHVDDASSMVCIKSGHDPLRKHTLHS